MIDRVLFGITLALIGCICVGVGALIAMFVFSTLSAIVSLLGIG